jgi:hypothetical protein
MAKLKTGTRIYGDAIVDNKLQITSGPVLVGSASSTGTASQRLQVTGGAYVSGSVGIGTTNPQNILHIEGSNARVRYVETDATVDNRIWNFGPNDQEFSWQAFTDAGSGGGSRFVLTRSGNLIQEFQGYFAGSPWFVINNPNQRVGIGTTNPTAKLDINGTLNVSDVISFASTITLGQNGKIVFPDITSIPDNPTNEKYSYITFGDNGSISQVSGRGALMIASSDDSLILANGDVGRTFTSSNIDVDIENIFLLSDGNVTVKTDLQSGFGSENTYTFAGGVITSPRFTSTQATGTAPFTVSSTTVVTNLNADTVDGIQASSFLRSDADDTASGLITLTNGLNVTNGNVGIGTTNPQSALDVRGDVTATNILPLTDNTGVVGDASFTWSNGRFTNLTVDSTINVRAAIDLADSDVLRFGSSDDWEFFHNGTDNYIDLNNGNLIIRDNTTTRFTFERTSGNLLLGSATSTGTASQPLQVTGGAYVSDNLGVGTTNPTSKLSVVGDGNFTGVVTATTFFGALTGTATTASSVTANSVGLGTDTFGDYVRDITGTANQITVTGGTGEGSTPTLSLPIQVTIPQDLTVLRDVQIDRNLNVTGNITIGGTAGTLFTETLKISDSDIVLGFRTDGSGNDVSNDTTANHGGIAVASTEGNPLVNLNIVGIETLPPTYKKIMWFKAGEFAGLGTDAWLFNYAVGIGSTQVPNGVRLAAGGMQVTDSTISSPQLNISGVSTLGNTSATNLTAQQLNVSGVSTISVNSSSNALRITQTGTGNALVVEDSSNPDSNPFVVNASGQVGIGTTNPFAGTSTSGLDVVGGINPIIFSRNTDLTGNSQSEIWAADGDWFSVPSYKGVGLRNYSPAFTGDIFDNIPYASGGALAFQNTNYGLIYTNGSSPLIFGTLSTEAMRIDGSQRLGIGTNSPTSKLHVVGDGYFTGILTANRIFSSVYGEFVGGSISGTDIVGTALSISGISTFNNGPVFIGSGTSTGTASQRLQVTGGAYISGSVGVGTTNPIGTLEVVGSVVADGVDIRNLPRTQLVSYASASDVSNSALSITGVSTYTLVGSFSTTYEYSYSGPAISADGRTIIVGNFYDSLIGGDGTVHVYDRVGAGSSIVQVGILTNGIFAGGGSGATDGFGYSVATSADGKTIAVGALGDELSGAVDYGLVYVFDRVGVGSASTFNQVGILTGFFATVAEEFGQRLTVSGNGKTIIVGAPNDERSSTTGNGLVYVFDRVGNSFNQVGILNGSLAIGIGDKFGDSVATSYDGKTIIVGAPVDEQTGSGSGSGVVYVFDRVGLGTSFNQVGILTGSFASNANDSFGISVATSADGKTIVVGAELDETGATLSTGVVYVFDRVGNSFNQVGIFTGSRSSAISRFGYSVATSADGTTIASYAPSDNLVYIHKRQGNSFTEVGIVTYTGNSTEQQKISLTADGKTLILSNEQGIYVYDQVQNTYLYSGSTGNIGIGTSNPSQALHVQGSVRVTGAVYDSTNSPGTSGQVLSSTVTGTQWTTSGGATGGATLDILEVMLFA